MDRRGTGLLVDLDKHLAIPFLTTLQSAFS